MNCLIDKLKRFSLHSLQGTASDLVVQIVLIAESMRLQAMMGTYGIQTQTPHEVEPVQIWPPKELVKVYEHLGLSKRLGLKVCYLKFSFSTLHHNPSYSSSK